MRRRNPEIGYRSRQDGSSLAHRHAWLDARVIQQAQQVAVVNGQVADHALLVESSPRIVLIVIRQTERVKQFVIGTVEEYIIALIDDDKGHRVHDVTIGS